MNSWPRARVQCRIASGRAAKTLFDPVRPLATDRFRGGNSQSLSSSFKSPRLDALICHNQSTCDDVISQADLGMLRRICRGGNRRHDA
jgi:hypothetical protein